MYSFQVVGTFTAAPSNLVSGISDMELVERDGIVTLYTATRAGGGVLALNVGGTMTLTDQEYLAPGTSLPAGASLDLLSVAGAPQLVVSGANQTGVRAFGLGSDGGLTTVTQLPGSLSGTISAQTVVQAGGSTYFYAARMGEATIHGYSVAANGTMTALAPRVLAGAQPGIDISAMSSVTVAGETFLMALSLGSDALRLLAVGPGGLLGAPSTIGAPQGLGLANPTDVEVVTAGGRTFLIIAGSGSSSVSVVELAAGGAMRVTDHVIDTLDTRFQNVKALATCTIGDRVFVIAGGADGGLTLMTLTPEGRLLAVGQQLQLPGLALHNITAMTARVVDGRIDLFVAGEGTGITRLQIEPGPLAPVLAGGAEAATLTGGAGGDLIDGGSGDERIEGGEGADILLDGAGADTLFGGAGADLFVLAADGALDVIQDFQLGIDRIDLSAWGRIHSLAALQITPTATGAEVVFGNEVLQIIAANGLPLLPQQFRLTDFIGLSHALPDPVANGNMLRGTPQIDLIIGTDGDDHIMVSAGADTLQGGAGFDILYFSEATALVRVSLAGTAGNAGLAPGFVYTGFEGLVGTRFSDVLTGDAGDNWLDGADHNDRLVGGAGNDSLFGGNGNDSLLGGTGNDVLDGGAGRDRASYRDSPQAIVLDLANLALNTGEAAGDRYLSIEEFEGSAHADTLSGAELADILVGLAGADLLQGRAGNDSLYGGDGDDVLVGGAGADRLEGGAGFDRASYADSAAALTIDRMTPSLSGGDAAGDIYLSIEGFQLTPHADRFFGNDMDDWAEGMAGNDRLEGRGRQRPAVGRGGQ